MELLVFLRQGLEFQRASRLLYRPHDLQMLASKTFEPPKGAAEGGLTGKVEAELLVFPWRGWELRLA